MKHHLSELAFRFYLWTCNCTRDEYYEWIENNIKVNKPKKLSDFQKEL